MVLEQAQQQYDKVKDVPGVGMLPQSLQLQQATIGYETAQANYRVTSPGLTGATGGRPGADRAGAGRAGSCSRAARRRSRWMLRRPPSIRRSWPWNRRSDGWRTPRLVAPWIGIVTTVAAVEGALAQPGVPALQLADQSQFHINVQVDEVDVASVAPDQPVVIELDALPGQKWAGHVHTDRATRRRWIRPARPPTWSPFISTARIRRSAPGSLDSQYHQQLAQGCAVGTQSGGADRS